MRHTIEELGDRAESDGRDGYFYIVRHRDGEEPQAGKWEAGMANSAEKYDHTAGYGETPDAAVQDMLNRQEERHS